jgi:succinate dehydrogenase hydrophobic anchor subunit
MLLRLFEEREVRGLRDLPWIRLALSGLIIAAIASSLLVVGLASRGASPQRVAAALLVLASFVSAVLMLTYSVRMMRGETLHFGVPPILDRRRTE